MNTGRCTFMVTHRSALLRITNVSGKVVDTEWHKKTGTFEKPNKNWRNQRKKIIDRNWTITTCLL